MTPDEYAAEVARIKRVLVKFVVVLVAVNLMLLGGVWVSSFEGRKNVVDSLRRGCERNIGNQRDNARGWLDQAASDGKIAADPFQSVATRRARARSAAQNRGRGLRILSRIRPCAVAYPDPGPFALHGG